MVTAKKKLSTYSKSIDWPKTVVRVLFGIVWLFAAYFKWQPSFRESFLDTAVSAGRDYSGWLTPWFNFWIGIISSHVNLFYYATAIIETLIALALILGFARKITYSLAAIFSLFIWSVPEAFGMPYEAGATDIGVGIIYALVFLALLALNSNEGTSRYSLDHLIEKKYPSWKKIAEI